MKKEAVNHPSHYGGKDNPYEAIKVVEAWDLDKDFYLGNVIKYISRAGKKDKDYELQDLKKALWYLQRKIDKLEDEYISEDGRAAKMPASGFKFTTTVIGNKDHCKCNGKSGEDCCCE